MWEHITCRLINDVSWCDPVYGVESSLCERYRRERRTCGPLMSCLRRNSPKIPNTWLITPRTAVLTDMCMYLLSLARRRNEKWLERDSNSQPQRMRYQLNHTRCTDGAPFIPQIFFCWDVGSEAQLIVSTQISEPSSIPLYISFSPHCRKYAHMLKRVCCEAISVSSAQAKM